MGEKETQGLRVHTNSQGEYMAGGGDKNHQPDEMLHF